MVVTLFFWSIIIIVPVHISFQSSWRMTWSNCYHHSNTHKSLGGMMVLAVPRPFRTSCWSTLRFMPQISEIHKFRVSMHFSKKKRCAHHVHQTTFSQHQTVTGHHACLPCHCCWTSTRHFESPPPRDRNASALAAPWEEPGRSIVSSGGRDPEDLAEGVTGGEAPSRWTMKVVAVVACLCNLLSHPLCK